MDEERQDHGENIQIGGKRRSSLGALSKSKPVTKLKSMFEQKGAVPVNSHLLNKLPPVHATQDTALISTIVAANISYTGPAPSLPPPAELPPATPSHQSCNFAPPPDVDAAVHPSPPLSADNLRTHNDSLQDGGEADTKWGKSPTSTGFLKRMGSSLKKALAPKSSAGKQKREACSPNCAGSEVSSTSPRPSGPLALTPASQPSSSSLDLNSRRDQMQSHPPQSPTICMGYEILSAQEEQDWSNERSRGGSSEVCLPVSVNDIVEDVATGAADAEAEIPERIELMSSTCMETSESARPAPEMPPSVDCGPSYDVPLLILPSSDATVEHTEPRQSDAEDRDWDADALNPTGPSTGGATPLPVHVDIATCAVTGIVDSQPRMDIPPASDDSPCVHEQACLYVPPPGSPRKASTPSVLPTNGHNMEDHNDAGAFGSEMSETAHWSAAGQTTDPESAGYRDPPTGLPKITQEPQVVVEAPTSVELLGSRRDTDLPPCDANSDTPSTSQEFDAVCQPTSTEVATPVRVTAIDSPSSAGVTNPPSPIDEVAAEVANPPSPIHEVPSDIIGQVVSVPLHVEDSEIQAACEVSSDAVQVMSAPLPECHAVCQLGSPEKLGDGFQPQQPDPMFELSTVTDMEIATPTLVLPVSASPPSSTAEVLPDGVDQVAAAPFTEVAEPEPRDVLGAEDTKQDSLPPVPESATVCQPMLIEEMSEDVLLGAIPACQPGNNVAMEVGPLPDATSEPTSSDEVSASSTPVGPVLDATFEPISIQEVSAGAKPVTILPDLRNDAITEPVGQDASSPDLKSGDDLLVEPVEDAVAEAVPLAADPAFEPSTSEGMEVASGLPLMDAFEFHAPLEVASGLTLTDAFEFHAPLQVSADVKEVVLASAPEVDAISQPTFADKMDEEDMQPAAASQGHPMAAAASLGVTRKLCSAQPSMECDYDLVAYGSAASELSHWGTNAAVSTTTDADAVERASVLQSSTSFFAAANEEMLRACTSVPAPGSYEPDLTESMAASPLRNVSPQFEEAVLDDPMIVSPMPPQSLRLSLAHGLSSDPLINMTSLPVHGIIPYAQSTMAVEVHGEQVPLAACVVRQLSAEHTEPPMNQPELVVTIPSLEPCGPPAVTTFHEVPPTIHELTGYMIDVAVEATDALSRTVHASNIGDVHVDTAVSENVPLADTLESFEAMWGNDNLLADTDKDESGLCSPLPMPLVVSSPVKQPEPYPASTHKVAPDVVLQVPRESLDLFSLRNSCTARVSDSLMVESLDGFEAASISAKARGIAFVPMAPLREASEHEDAPESPVTFRSNGGAEGAQVSDGGAPPTVALTPALQPGNLTSGGAGTPSANRPAAMVRQAPTPHTAGKAGSAPASRAGTPGGPHAAAPSTALKALAAATGTTSAGKSSAAKRSAPGSRAAAPAHASNSTSGGRTSGTSASNTPKQATPMMPGAVGASGTAHLRAGFTPRSAGVFSAGTRAQSAVGDRPAQPPAVGLPSASMGLFDTPTLQRAAAVPLTDSPFGCDFDLDIVDISAEASKAIAVLEGGQQKAMAGNLRTPPVAVNTGKASGLPGTPTVSFLETHVLLLTSKLAEAEAKSHQLQEENTMLRDQLSTLQFESSMTNDLDMEREARQFLEQELAVVRHRADALDAELHTAQNELKQRTEAIVLLEARLEQMLEEQRVRDEAEVRKQRAHEESQAQLLRAHEDAQGQLQRARDEAEAKFQKAMEQLIAAQTAHKRQTVEYEQKIQQQNTIIAQFVELRDKFRQMKQHVTEADQRVHAADQRTHLAENKVQEATAALNMALAEKAELMRMCNELLTQLEVSKARGR